MSKLQQISHGKPNIVSGKIFKLLGGFYYVISRGKEYECKARGLFRKNKIKPIVGDVVDVQIDELDDTKGYIVNVKERVNTLVRPEVANIDLIVIVFAFKSPNPNLYLLDLLIANALERGITPIIIFNKLDLADEFQIQRIHQIYKRTNLQIIFNSILDGGNCTNLLKQIINGQTATFAGPSGVGKSSIISQIVGRELKCGNVSQKKQ